MAACVDGPSRDGEDMEYVPSGRSENADDSSVCVNVASQKVVSN